MTTDSSRAIRIARAAVTRGYGAARQAATEDPGRLDGAAAPGDQAGNAPVGGGSGGVRGRDGGARRRSADDGAARLRTEIREGR